MVEQKWWELWNVICRCPRVIQSVLRQTQLVTEEIQSVMESAGKCLGVLLWQHSTERLRGYGSLSLIVFMMGGRWPYSCCFVGCCLQDLFNIAHNILVSLPSSFFSICLVSIHVVHPYSSINTTTAWKKLRFILSVGSDFHMTDSLSIAVHAFLSCMSMSVPFDETLLPR